MELIPAPSRVFKQHSFIISAVLVVFDMVQAITHIYETQGALDITTVAVINAVLATAATLAKLYQQQIPATEEQKQDMINVVESLPTKAPKVK